MLNKQQIQKQIYANSYYEFFVDALKVLEPQTIFQDNWHIKYLCDELQEMIERAGSKKTKKHDLIVNIPPRSMKSMIVSVCLNAWAWIKYPHLNFVSCSYGLSLSADHCQKTRALIESPWYQDMFCDSFQLLKDQNQKTNFRIEYSANNSTDKKETNYCQTQSYG